MFILPFLCLIEMCTDQVTGTKPTATEEEEQGLDPHYQKQRVKCRHMRDIQIKTAMRSVSLLVGALLKAKNKEKKKKNILPCNTRNERTLALD